MCNAVGKLPNLVWFNYRRVPAIAMAKRLIEEGRLGRILHYRASYFNESGADPAKGHSWRYRRARLALELLAIFCLTAWIQRSI